MNFYYRFNFNVAQYLGLGLMVAIGVIVTLTLVIVGGTCYWCHLKQRSSGKSVSDKNLKESEGVKNPTQENRSYLLIMFCLFPIHHFKLNQSIIFLLLIHEPLIHSLSNFRRIGIGIPLECI